MTHAARLRNNQETSPMLVCMLLRTAVKTSQQPSHTRTKNQISALKHLSELKTPQVQRCIEHWKTLCALENSVICNVSNTRSTMEFFTLKKLLLGFKLLPTFPRRHTISRLCPLPTPTLEVPTLKTPTRKP